jgi:hypothetical protein
MNVAEFYDAAITKYHDNGPWYFDSGTSGYITADSHKVEQYGNPSGVQIREVWTGGGEPHLVVGVGSSTVHIDSGTIKLTNVKYVPSMTVWGKTLFQ